MANKHCDKDSLAEKTIGDLNEEQKDKLINSFIYALRRISEGVKNFLTFFSITAAIIILFFALRYAHETIKTFNENASNIIDGSGN